MSSLVTFFSIALYIVSMINGKIMINDGNIIRFYCKAALIVQLSLDSVQSNNCKVNHT